MILSYFFGPDFLHREDSLARDFEPVFDLNAVIGHLRGIPSSADAEQESPVGDAIQSRDRLGQIYRVMFRDQTNRRT